MLTDKSHTTTSTLRRPPKVMDKNAKQVALFKALMVIRDELFEGTNKYLAVALNISRSTITKWDNDGKCGYDPDFGGSNNYQRLIHLIAIYSSLCAIFTASSDRVGWFNSPNTDFSGRTPRSLVEGNIEALLFVKGYLNIAKNKGA